MNKKEIINKQIELHTIAMYDGEEYELENLMNGILEKIEEKDKKWQDLKNYLLYYMDGNFNYDDKTIKEILRYMEVLEGSDKE